MTARLSWGLDLPLMPFFGVMGVAPPANWGRISTIQPRAHGGNLDNKELVAGSTLYLPIFMLMVHCSPAVMGMVPKATVKCA
jgi:acetamidase/formamidase